MDIKEMFAKYSSGEVAAHSELGTRDENKQTRNFGTRISKMKTVTGINARAMAMKDLVIKFNPFTGKSDETYNAKTPFRPILLVSQTIEGLKDAMASNPEMKTFWEKELGITLNPGPATMEEYLAFKAKGYIFPRVMSYYTVSLNFGGLRGFPDFKVKYTVDPEQLNPESHSYDPETAPVWHKAAVFFNAILKREADDIVKALEDKGANKDAIKDQRSAIYSKAPVSFVRPTNNIPFLFYPLDVIPKAPDPDNPTAIEADIRFYSYTDKWVTALKEAMSKPTFDEDIDFFDFTIKTPSSNDRQMSGKVYTDEDANAIYQAMTITNTDGRMALHTGSTTEGSKTVPNKDVFAPILEAARRYFLYSQEQSSAEGGETFEKIMAASSRFRPITQAMSNFLPACNDAFLATFATSPYFTDDVKKANSEFFTMMNPRNALALAAEDEDELQAAADEQRQGLNELIQEANGGEGVGELGTSGIDMSDLNLEG